MGWTRGPIVGLGSFAAVSTATAHGSGELFAVKSAELSDSQSLQREQRILSTLDCPQIVAYKGWDITCENGKLMYNLHMEYARDGSLVDVIREHGGQLDERTVKLYTRAIVRGLVYLHSRGIAHGDIKGQNVLVTSRGGVKIADLGLARQVNDDDRYSNDSSLTSEQLVGGTPLFMAPEVACGRSPGFTADVWALGCTVIEMATGRPPWKDVHDPVSAIYRIRYSTSPPEIPSSMSEQGKDFLSKCMRRDPLERWSASELLNHAFLESPDGFTAEEIKIPCTVKSPTCVLDGPIWSWSLSSTIERLEPSVNPSSQRIQQLITISSAEVPNWEFDENWVTVRGCEPSEETPETTWSEENVNGRELAEEASCSHIEDREEDPVGLMLATLKRSLVVRTALLYNSLFSCEFARTRNCDCSMKKQEEDCETVDLCDCVQFNENKIDCRTSSFSCIFGLALRHLHVLTYSLPYRYLKKKKTI